MMTQSFFIPGTLPDLNTLIAAAKRRSGRWSGYATLKKEWTEIIIAHIKEAKLIPVRNPIFIYCFWWEKNRKRDKDNICGAKKLICDALKEAGIIPHDGWAWIVGFDDKFGVACGKVRIGVFVALEEQPAPRTQPS